MPVPSIKNIKYFVAVAQHKSFSTAAEVCFVSQSTLSAGIKRLEQELGTCLIERNSKQVQFTPVGKEVLAQAQQLINTVDMLVSTARKDFFSSHLRLGSIPTVAPFLLPEMMHVWQTKYPNLSVTIEENTTENLLLQLRTYQIDCAIIALPYDIGNLLSFDLFTDTLHFFHKKNSRWIQHKHTHKESGLLLLSAVHCLRDHVLRNLPVQTHYMVNVFNVQSLHTLVALVSADVGVSYMPAMAIKNNILSQCSSLTYSEESLDARTISLIYRADSYHQQQFKELMSHWKK